MRLLIDMNLSPKWVDSLQTSGIEAAHWSVLGLPSAQDEEIMAFAKINGFVVLTNDLDFGAILAATGNHGPSVIQIRADDCRTEAIAEMVTKAIKQLHDQLTEGALVTVDASRARITSLPIAHRRA